VSWENSDTRDVLRGARNLVLSVANTMDVMMDEKDPLGCLRLGEDRDGEPLPPEDMDEYGALGLMYVMEGRLRRANSALHEVLMRMDEWEAMRGGEDTAVVPAEG